MPQIAITLWSLAAVCVIAFSMAALVASPRSGKTSRPESGRLSKCHA
jgi:hypothetical protein